MTSCPVALLVTVGGEETCYRDAPCFRLNSHTTSHVHWSMMPQAHHFRRHPPAQMCKTATTHLTPHHESSPSLHRPPSLRSRTRLGVLQRLLLRPCLARTLAGVRLLACSPKPPVYFLHHHRLDLSTTDTVPSGPRLSFLLNRHGHRAVVCEKLVWTAWCVEIGCIREQ